MHFGERQPALAFTDGLATAFVSKLFAAGIAGR